MRQTYNKIGRISRSFSTKSKKLTSEEAKIKLHQCEKMTPTNLAAINLRRGLVSQNFDQKEQHVENLPLSGADFDHTTFYDNVHGTNCENVVGFMTLPVGVAGPLIVNDKSYIVPLGTSEGALIASINRGCSVIKASGGVFSKVISDSMTRAPVVKMKSSKDAILFSEYLETRETFQKMKEIFESTTRFGKLKSVRTKVAGRFVYIKFKASTGDAMGMNMVGKGVNEIFTSDLFHGESKFYPELMSLSSNLCTDKKPSAVNWIEGRGKSVIAEVVITEETLQNKLKVGIDELIELNVAKNLIGSALAGSIGGNNAHSSNIVTAIFLATGQDCAQNIESANCLLQFEKTEKDGQKALHASVTMPSVEVGTVGGGTSLPTQRSCLEMLGVAGACMEDPGRNARTLAEIIAASTLAGELSLNAALRSDHLISAHMDLNRK